MGGWIDARRLGPAVMTPPVSKSDAQRAALLGWLAGAPPVASPDAPEDVRVLQRGLIALSGPGDAAIDCRDGGTPLRMLVGQAAIRRGRTSFTGSPRLGARTHEPLLAALERTLGAAGARVDRGAPWPLVITGAERRATAARFEIDARESSQFASSLLFVAAALARREARPWQVGLIGPSASPGYLDLTRRWLEWAGFELGPEGTVHAGAPRALPPVPADWSSAAYLAILAWRSGGSVRMDAETVHPDRAILAVLQTAGLQVAWSPHGLVVTGTPIRGTHATGKDSPDLLPTVAALATALPGPTTLADTAILVGKESDRLAALCRMVEAAGATVTREADRLTITPGRPPPEIRLAVHGDHRLAMSAAVLAAVTGSRVWIDDPDVVSKSFPGFWREVERIGVRLDSDGADVR